MENQYLNEESFKALMDKILNGTDPEWELDLESLSIILPSFHAYVDEVVRGETKLLMNPKASGQEYRALVSDYDEKRHNCHEAAITNAKALNRLADRYGISPVFTGDAAQRHQVAAFCLELDQYLFVNRRMKLA